MDGTTRPREPSGRGMSIARPKLMSSRFSGTGLAVSSGSKPWFVSGISVIASIIAQPIRWVKETLPARWRLRWLLITRRLSNSSFTGTSRTEVAVGTPSDSSMFRATAAAGPRSLTTSGSRSSTAGICAVVVGTFSGRSEVVETAGCVEAAESVEVLEVSAFTAEESFEGWAAGVGAAWEEGEESDVLSPGAARAGAGGGGPRGGGRGGWRGVRCALGRRGARRSGRRRPAGGRGRRRGGLRGPVRGAGGCARRRRRRGGRGGGLGGGAVGGRRALGGEVLRPAGI